MKRLCPPTPCGCVEFAASCGLTLTPMAGPKVAITPESKCPPALAEIISAFTVDVFHIILMDYVLVWGRKGCDAMWWITTECEREWLIAYGADEDFVRVVSRQVLDAAKERAMCHA